MKNKIVSIALFIFLTGLFVFPGYVWAGVDGYNVLKRSDGGYKITISYSKRHWQPITAEGFFPVEKRAYVIEIIGKGERWDYRNQKGIFYNSSCISSNIISWDIGYVWIDEEGKNIYLNLYWISAPDNIAPSDINGKYELNRP